MSLVRGSCQLTASLTEIVQRSSRGRSLGLALDVSYIMCIIRINNNIMIIVIRTCILDLWSFVKIQADPLMLPIRLFIQKAHEK